MMDSFLTFPKTQIFKVCTKTFEEKLPEYLLKCWKEAKYCDINVVVGEQTFPTHRFMLAMISEYFRGLFDNTTVVNNEITLHDIEADIFKNILEFAYTGSVEISPSNVERLVVATDFYCVQELKESCELMLLQNLDQSNLMQMIVFSDRYLFKELEKTCLTRIYKSFYQLSKSQEFLQLPIDVIRCLIGNTESSIKIYKTPKYLFPLYDGEIEELFFTTTISYISHNFEYHNKTSLLSLLKLIDLQKLNIDMMKKFLSSFKNIKHDTDILGLIDLSRTESFGVIRKEVICTFSNSAEFASGGRVGFDGRETYIKSLNGYAQPRTILLISRKWDGREVIGGIEIEYTDTSILQYGMKKTDGKKYKKYKVELSEGEVITECVIYSGYLVDSFKFRTNFDKSYGPHGGNGGGRRIYKAVDSSTYLHDFQCEAVITQDSLALINCSVGWITIQ